MRRCPFIVMCCCAALCIHALGCREPESPQPPPNAPPERVATTASAPAGSPKTPPAPRNRPYALVLGTAQDGGLPQIGCNAAHCQRAHRDGAFRRLVTSLLVCDPRSGKRWLFDASPDLREQVQRARSHPPTRRPSGPRPALFDGIFLTHAHMGHYTGLMFLGREAYGAKGVPVYGTDRMRAFLRDNGPWSQLVELGNIALRPLPTDEPIALEDDITVRALPVKHRDEFSDTVAFIVSGPSQKLLYLPDIDKWQRWNRSIKSEIWQVDVALLDGTFFGDGEVPGRAMEEIPHPFIEESIARLADLPGEQRGKVWFTHLNHSNPAADPDSDETKRIHAAGMSVAHDMQLFPL